MGSARILLGREIDGPSSFGFGSRPQGSRELVYYDGDAPVCIIAPTGSGKGRDVLIPQLLSYSGNVIAVDLKGELSAITRSARLRLGQNVRVLDPFGITAFERDRLNPFDLFASEGSMMEPDAEVLATLLGTGHASGTDRFWSDTAGAMIAGLIAAVASRSSPDDRHMGTLRDMLYHEDVDFFLAKLIDEDHSIMSRFAYDEIAAYLQHAPTLTRPSVLSTARTFLKALNTSQVTACLRDSTISLRDVIDGKPQTIYITIPPDKLRSHGFLLRLWIGVFLVVLMRRRVIPEEKTLLVVDEAAQLGTFDPLLTATTLLRGYGVQLISIWQDLAQIKGHYPLDWPSILNNAGVLMSFGQAHYGACKEYAEVLGLDVGELLNLGQDEAIISVRGGGIRKIQRLNYLTEEMFRGMADPNPFYRGRDGDAGREMGR